MVGRVRQSNPQCMSGKEERKKRKEEEEGTGSLRGMSSVTWRPPTGSHLLKAP